MHGVKGRMNKVWVVVRIDRYNASLSQQVMVNAFTVGEAFVKGFIAMNEDDSEGAETAAEYLMALVVAENGDAGIDFEEESWFVSELNM